MHIHIYTLYVLYIVQVSVLYFHDEDADQAEGKSEENRLRPDLYRAIQT